MIKIERSPTADTRTCDFTKVTLEQLRASSEMHVRDVRRALAHLAYKLKTSGIRHDFDKLSPEGLTAFHSDFINGFKTTSWWDNHRKVNRHHLNNPDGVPANVDLIDVLEYIVDCVMAGAARSDKGTAGVYKIQISPEILAAAVDNTVEKLKANVTVIRSKS